MYCNSWRYLASSSTHWIVEKCLDFSLHYLHSQTWHSGWRHVNKCHIYTELHAFWRQFMPVSSNKGSETNEVDSTKDPHCLSISRASPQPLYTHQHTLSTPCTNTHPSGTVLTSMQRAAFIKEEKAFPGWIIKSWGHFTVNINCYRYFYWG